MAILAAFASLFHTDLMRIVSKPWQRQAWHFSGSVAMGLGVWAMHFIGITKNLGMEVIAEGVETKEQQQRLAQSGCLRYQGYLFSRPAPADELPKG